MTVTPTPLGKARLSNAPTVVYTVPGGAISATIRSITASNLLGTTQTLSIWLVNPGQNAGDEGTTIVSGIGVPASGALQDDGVHVLLTGGRVIAQAGVDDGFDVVVDGAVNT